MFQLFCTIYYIIYILCHIVFYYILFTIGCFQLLAVASSTFDWWWTLGPKVRVRVLGKVNTYEWNHCIGQKFKAYNITRKVAEENIASKKYQKIYETFQM